ncbi:spermidine N1-acetyltransferase [Coxiella burnetii]|uniref:Spermidine N1-acetyltransferase n=2 Tax=Coxiella burnetii TaxID=777 RepID=Q83B40_COXBU|nr:spermidine N1-acetyltransferase [Coxiella burnetii]NP_820660.1 spermidine N1-acetyltransferase [Coxiella burnetii RSA 493]AAO91174.1 spermidine N1-acetyltransferase [Coxiella burnetii RSA 493]ABS78037.1 spermidine N1-acetyltransferase [Coxiella burnetii Dugway 5J108-111]ABX78312.1 diamine N-acetyltransferase [Coxiella burnetii RSA 331]AIT62659.1 Spermidine N(1)-acetyltransferase [Coxiella burnetii str. Namibia]AML48422.1 spermidine acetyltransferase [Coxiella burnetii]
MLLGKKIRLSALEREDLKFVHELNNNLSIMSYWFEEPYESYRELEDLHIKHIHDQSERRFIIKDLKDNKVGLVELTEIDFIHRRCEFAIIISPGEEGKGYATEATDLTVEYAFSILNLHKIYLLVDEDNPAALHIYRKSGFAEEGKLVDEYYSKGRYRTAIRMYVLKKSL